MTCKDTLRTYQAVCLFLGGLSFLLTCAVLVTYYFMRKQINYLVRVHNLGNVPMDTDAGQLSERSANQKSRDAIVRVIKYNLEQYLKYSNADFEIDGQDYNYNY